MIYRKNEYADAMRKFDSHEKRLTFVEQRLDNQYAATEQILSRLARLERLVSGSARKR